MRVTKFIHSCLMVEKAGSRILFDPGKFSFIEGAVTPEEFRGVDAVIVTHAHPDHVDYDALAAIVQASPGVEVLTNATVAAEMAERGLQAVLFEGGKRTVGRFEVAAYGAAHAPVLGSKAPPNTAFVIDDVLLNAGDSFDAALHGLSGVKMLALPVTAPWTTELVAAEFARRMRPGRVIPVHDGYWKPWFRAQRYKAFEQVLGEAGIGFEGVAEVGGSVEI